MVAFGPWSSKENQGRLPSSQSGRATANEPRTVYDDAYLSSASYIVYDDAYLSSASYITYYDAYLTSARLIAMTAIRVLSLASSPFKCRRAVPAVIHKHKNCMSESAHSKQTTARAVYSQKSRDACTRE